MTFDPITGSGRETLFACLDGVVHAGLAVSGGADSMALMHLARLWRDETVKKTPRFTVLSVDHGLRAESAGEAEWVAQQASAYGFPCAVLRWRPGEKRSRIQADARQARYDLMAAYAHTHGLDALVTAHHLDDQAETLLMRLARGSGLDGLTGISQCGRWAGLAVLRPFLDAPKGQLVATLEALDEDWLEDPSNDDARFERVRLRRAMIELEKLGIGADALALSAKRLRRAREALDATAGLLLKNHGQVHDAGFCQIGLAAFLDAPEEITLRVLARVLQGVGGRVSPPRLARLETLLEALKSGNDAALTLGGCLVSRHENEILIVREAGRAALGQMVLQPGENGLWDNRYHVSLDRTSREAVEVRALGTKGYGEVRARLGRAVTLPEHAAQSLVSFWRDDSVVAVPPLRFAARSSGCCAEFVNRALF